MRLRTHSRCLYRAILLTHPLSSSKNQYPSCDAIFWAFAVAVKLRVLSGKRCIRGDRFDSSSQGAIALITLGNTLASGWERQGIPPEFVPHVNGCMRSRERQPEVRKMVFPLRTRVTVQVDFSKSIFLNPRIPFRTTRSSLLAYVPVPKSPQIKLLSDLPSTARR
jgi:hypothetical protein